ncbi:uncharacterized protein LOC108602373 [Drosophila busckii]|uniref:uncharacterized protein LOC108602373 n=1 Tax=Drosophila busckii TaxID=30019 RepID=UPI00083F3466|nr:uncharacterized protein LOC108602373 [Drosophila busckii]
MSKIELAVKKKHSLHTKRMLEATYFDLSLVRQNIIENVLCVLRDAMERVRITLILPQILKDPDYMTKVLTGTKYQDVLPLVDDFMRRLTFILKEKRSPLMDHAMVQIMDYFQRHYHMYELFPGYLNSLGPQERKLHYAYERLIDISRYRLQKDAKQQVESECHIVSMMKENKELKADIAEMQAKLDKRTAHRLKKEAVVKAVLTNIQDEVNTKREKFEAVFQNESAKCQRTTRVSQRKHLDKMYHLDEELVQVRGQYRLHVSKQHQREKELRDEINKLQIQFQGVLKKYDYVIGEKQRENLLLLDQYDIAKQQLDIFMILYRKEEAIYKQIVVRREEKLKAERRHRIIVFSMNRAAAVIQKYWRKWRKHMAKKNRGGGKRKK